MALGEAVPLPTRLHFYEPYPTPNSDDVDFYTKWKEGPDDIDVDKIVNRWRRQERWKIKSRPLWAQNGHGGLTS